jgi:hypothetical protein
MEYYIEGNIYTLIYEHLIKLYIFFAKDIYTNLIILSSNMMLILYMIYTNEYVKYYDTSVFLLELYTYKQVILAIIVMKYEYELYRVNTIIKLLLTLLSLYYFFLKNNNMDIMYLHTVSVISINNGYHKYKHFEDNINYKKICDIYELMRYHNYYYVITIAIYAVNMYVFTYQI